MLVDAEITSNTSPGFILDSFLTFINQHGLDLEKSTTLLAVSGGVDSVVMADLFHKMGFHSGIAHCNFGLRGEESEEDEQFVLEMAKKYGFKFYSTRFDVKSFAKKKSISTQMSARELRYEWFEEIRKANGYQWIATAHHADDSLETVVLNLVRGTGLPGLQGISGVRGRLIRPLIYTAKEGILKFAYEKQLVWREDRSNNSDDYKRNLIRHKVIPVFEQLNPSLQNTFKATSERLTAANGLLHEYLLAWKAKAVRKELGFVKISINSLVAESEPIYKLWFILQDFGFVYNQMRQIFGSLKGLSGKKFLSDSHILLIDRNDLILKEKLPGEQIREWAIQELQDQIPIEDQILSFELQSSKMNGGFESGKKDIFLDLAILRFPLKIRNWQEGDVFYPFGMKGKKKKLSDLFTDLKLDRFQKSEVKLLVNGNGEIIWVIGFRSDERYRISGEQEKIVKVSLSFPEQQ